MKDIDAMFKEKNSTEEIFHSWLMCVSDEAKETSVVLMLNNDEKSIDKTHPVSLDLERKKTSSQKQSQVTFKIKKTVSG